jgi:hypothetical protein
MGERVKKIISSVTAFVMLAMGTSALAAAFTKGNIVVYRIGDGTAQLTNIGSIVYLDEYTTNTGTLVQSVLMPTNFFGAYYPLIANGSASAEGEMSLSADGRFLVVPGYGARLNGGKDVLSGISAATVPRVYGLVGGNGYINTTTAQTNSLSDSPENPRSAASTDGTNIWFGGDTGGLRYTSVTNGAEYSGCEYLCTQLSSQDTNIRQINIFNNVLYFSSATATYPIRLGQITNAMPAESSGSFMQSLTNMPTSGALSPYGFVLLKTGPGAAPLDTLYLVSDTNNVPNLYKYCLDSGGWTLKGTGITAENARGLTGSIGSDGNVHLYMVTAPSAGSGSFTGGGYILAFTDSAGFDQPMTNDGADIGDVNDWILTVPLNKVCRGIAYAPQGGDPYYSGNGRISVGPISGITSTIYTGCTSTATNIYSIGNPGLNGPVTWTVGCDQTWVTLSTAGGSLASGSTNSLTITFNSGIQNLGLGTNTANLTFSNTSIPDYGGDTIKTINLIVTNGLSVSPAYGLVSFGFTNGAIAPGSVSYAITNLSCLSLGWAAISPSNWVTLSATSGTVAPGAGATLTVSTNSNTEALPEGNYVESIIISNTTAQVEMTERIVNFSLKNPPAFFCDDFSASPYTAGALPGQDDWAQRGATNAFWTFEYSWILITNQWQGSTTLTNIWADQGSGILTGYRALGASGGYWTNYSGDASSHSGVGIDWSQNDYWLFQVCTLGSTGGVQVAWDQNSSNTGPRDWAFEYSTDNSSWTLVETNSIVAGITWNITSNFVASHFAADLTGVTALDNQPAVYFRLRVNSNYSTGGSVGIGSGGTDRLDNFLVTTMAPPTPIQIDGSGKAWVPGAQTAVQPDVWKDIPPQTNVATFAGMVMTVTNAPTVVSGTPSFFVALPSGNNGAGADSTNNYQLTAKAASAGYYYLGGRITGISAWTYGAAQLQIGTQYRVIIQTDPSGNNMVVYVNPTDAVLGDQTPYLTASGGGGAATIVGGFTVTQNKNGSNPTVGVAINKVCVNNNYATVYNGMPAPVTGPTASFGPITPVSGVAPLTVTFENLSSGTAPITNYWSYGDGATYTNYTGVNVSHQYGAGTWTAVSLTASNAVGYSTATSNFPISVITPFQSWQNYYFPLGGPNAADSADPSHDGVSNTNKFLSGFNPTNNASYAHIISIVKQGAGMNVTYLGANGDTSYAGGPSSRTNVLEYTTGTATGNYSNNFTSTGVSTVLSNGTGYGVVTNMVDPNGATGQNRYYHIRIIAP